MLRITPQSGGADRAAKVEGKLVGPWVETLRQCCDADRPTRLDLAGLAYADDAGVLLLRQLLATGTTLVSCPALIAELLRGEER